MGQNLEDIRFDGELFLEDVLEKLHKKMDGKIIPRWTSMDMKIMIISRHFCIR